MLQEVLNPIGLNIDKGNTFLHLWNYSASGKNIMKIKILTTSSKYSLLVQQFWTIVKPF